MSNTKHWTDSRGESIAYDEKVFNDRVEYAKKGEK